MPEANVHPSIKIFIGDTVYSQPIPFRWDQEYSDIPTRLAEKQYDVLQVNRTQMPIDLILTLRDANHRSAQSIQIGLLSLLRLNGGELKVDSRHGVVVFSAQDQYSTSIG